LRTVAAALAALAFAVPASAQIAVSANDGKAVLVNGVNTVPSHPEPDTVTIIDLGRTPPRVLGEVKVPTSARERRHFSRPKLRADHGCDQDRPQGRQQNRSR
jgi:hypothetical protein